MQKPCISAGKPQELFLCASCADMLLCSKDKVKPTCVDGPHHGFKDPEADVGDRNNAGLLLLVVAIKHRPAAARL